MNKKILTTIILIILIIGIIPLKSSAAVPIDSAYIYANKNEYSYFLCILQRQKIIIYISLTDSPFLSNQFHGLFPVYSFIFIYLHMLFNRNLRKLGLFFFCLLLMAFAFQNQYILSSWIVAFIIFLCFKPSDQRPKEKARADVSVSVL